jgi:hypothetical protein
MNESSSEKSPSDECFLHLLALQYLLAGDVESLEPLNLLEARRRAIDWDNPQFMEFSQQARAGVPLLTPDEVAASQPSLLHLLYAVLERKNNDDDIIRSEVIPNLKKQIEQQLLLNQAWEENSHVWASALKLITKLVEVHQKMRDQLELLGADISPYEIDPETP